MKTTTALFAMALSTSCLVGSASAVELLVSGDFETPMGVGDVPGWKLEEFATGSDALRSTAEIGVDISGEMALFLTPFNGGGPLYASEGNFDDDGFPQGDVDGHDFLTWQRGFGAVGTALPQDGDADANGDVDAADFAAWHTNFGGKSLLTNAVLTQTVSAASGLTYQFSGTSLFEANYSGLVTQLEPDGPFGAIPSPTTTNFKLEFLDAARAVIGTSAILDLRSEQIARGSPGVALDHTPLVAQAPPETAFARVTVEARNMVWNSDTQGGGLQLAIFDHFSLTASNDAGSQLLANPDLEDPTPDALDFWDLSTNPDRSENPEILRTPIEPWANHTPGGTRGVWLSAFFGAHNGFEPEPVDGIMSQTVDAVAGGTYTFSGWTKFEGNYSGGVDTISAAGNGLFAGLDSPTQTTIELAFLNVDGDVIGTPLDIDVRASRREQSPTNNANDDQWYRHVLNGVAPAGTVRARLTGSMIAGVFNRDPGQSAFFDDFSLDGPVVASASSSSVPEPTSIVFALLGCAIPILARSRRS